MSVDISWPTITSGGDGLALAENIRTFFHAKFQQIQLPKFIKAVHVHAFEFGSIPPKIEIKDICDPLPEFYDEDSGESHGSDISVNDLEDSTGSEQLPSFVMPGESSLAGSLARSAGADTPLGATRHTMLGLHNRTDSYANGRNPWDGIARSIPRVGTPGIPGGTSNMSYFHFPMGCLSGAQTPLAAVAGGNPFATQAWLQDQQAHDPHPAQTFHQREHSRKSVDRSSISEFSSNSSAKDVPGLAEKVSDEITSELPTRRPTINLEQIDPSDLQVVAHVTYDGDVRMVLTAEILLDYPMPSFVKIPLKLTVTGMSFDGVAILACIKRNMHFCFLDPEDAETLVGSLIDPQAVDSAPFSRKHSSLKGLLQEIRVETEIGRQEDGKQVLKNVSKVERFVLEQVRQIFEDEFVFPSFWTFLV